MPQNQTATLNPHQEFNAPTDKYNRVANWCIAGFENQWVRLNANDQRKLLGVYVGKGRISVECWDSRWVAVNWVSAAFGTDISYNGYIDLETGVKSH